MLTHSVLTQTQMGSNQQLKVDITTIGVDQPGFYLLLLNFNIPRSIVEENLPLSLEQVLIDVAKFLHHHFFPLPIYYQVTASYNLLNRETGDTRLFTGSFSPGSANISSLSGDIFKSFRRDTFPGQVQQYATQANILNCLQRPNDEDSKWTFQSLASLIINCQLQLKGTHTFIVQKNLLLTRGNRHGRRHINIVHPW